MKWFVFVLLSAFIAAAAAELSPEAEEKFGGRIKECITESGVADEMLGKVRAAQPTENTPELKVGASADVLSLNKSTYFELRSIFRLIIIYLNNIRRTTQRACSKSATC